MAAEAQPQCVQINMDEEGIQALSLQKMEIGTSKVGFLLTKGLWVCFFLPSCWHLPDKCLSIFTDALCNLKTYLNLRVCSLHGPKASG